MKRRALAAAIFGIAGTAVLIGLGTWQLQRLAWKEGVIARLEERLAAAPVPLPAAPDPARDGFLRVRVEGTLDEDVLRVLTSRKPHGPGYRVIAPLATGDGRRILVDLGYVPEEMKGGAVRPGQRAEVTGALYWPDEVDAFTPEPDRETGLWFARDLGPMAEALGTEPVLVVAETHGLGAWPMPLRLGISIANDHLEYAITWFSLALIWAVGSYFLVRREQAASA